MNKEEIEYWLKIFANNKHAFMSSDGKKIGYYEILKQLQKREHNWNELKKWLENLIKENDTTIKKCDQVIFKMGNENRKDTHQHKLIDVCSRESLVFNRILSKMAELEEGGNNE